MTTVSITCDVDVDIDDVFDELTKDQQRAFLARCDNEGRRAAKDIIREACVMIRRGDAIDAARFLEAEFFPKWQSVGNCAAALKKAKAP